MLQTTIEITIMLQTTIEITNGVWGFKTWFCLVLAKRFKYFVFISGTCVCR